MREQQPERQTEHGFHFVGEHLCLDFVNTQVTENGSAADLLGGFDEVVAWAVGAKLIDRTQARELSLRWGGGRDADRVFSQAVQLRASLRAMAERLAEGRTIDPQMTLDRINDVLRVRDGDLEVVRTKEGYETRFQRRFSEPAHLLVPVAESAAALLSSGDLALVKKCQDPRCILFFYDTTKNHGRRWCSMTACGNRAKVAAHYKRTRQDAAGTS
jgi:predicted RNA-binding Zn ribbon-like protein